MFEWRMGGNEANGNARVTGTKIPNCWQKLNIGIIYSCEVKKC